MKRPVASLFLCVTLAGCAPPAVYHQPGVSVARLQSDLLSCEVAALKDAPVANQIRRSPPVFIPSRRFCNSDGHCYHRGGYFAHGDVYTVDVNARLRNDLEDQCMTRKGYQSVALPRCTGAVVRTPAATPGRVNVMQALTPNSCVARDDENRWQVIPQAPRDLSLLGWLSGRSDFKPSGMTAMIPTPAPDLDPVKAVSQTYAAALEAASAQTVASVLSEHLAPDCRWYGMHPFHEQTGPAAIAGTFWEPFLTSFSRVQRREDIFFAGLNEIDGFSSTWTCSMGHFMGLFDAPFLNIPATRKIAMLRYAEFNKIENGRITQSALFIDLLHLMAQAGLDPLSVTQTGAQLVQPGPRTHDGLLTTAQDTAQSQKTLARINNMISSIDHANAAIRPPSPEDELAVDWHDDMVWWGPTGIGATYTIERYIQQHQAPFRRAMQGRVLNGHLCRMAEGTYGGFFGWPNLTLTNKNGFMGVPGNDIRADMRVVDIYRRAGEKLVENWIFIDMLHFLNMQGVDILAEIDA